LRIEAKFQDAAIWCRYGVGLGDPLGKRFRAELFEQGLGAPKDLAFAIK
jgi:hypothetical protein